MLLWYWLLISDFKRNIRLYFWYIEKQSENLIFLQISFQLQNFVAFIGPYLPNDLCDNKATGNHELRIDGKLYPHHILQCVHGIEYCQQCAYNNPLLVYNLDCNECLFPEHSGKCINQDQLLLTINYLCKTLGLRYLSGFWIRFWALLSRKFFELFVQ